MEAVRIASEELCTNITRALCLISELTDISKEKEAFLLNGSIEELRCATEKEEELIAELNRTENDRKNCADVLSQSIGLKEKDIKLKDIIEAIADGAIRKRLKDAGDKLTDAIETMSAQNGKLAQLLGLQISYTEYMLNILYNPEISSNSYDIQGVRRDNSSRLSRYDMHI